MYFSHLLESDFSLTTGNHTQMTKENSKGMKNPSASNVRKVTFQGSPYNVYTLNLHLQVTLSKSRFETITMPTICSLIEHGFLPVFSIEKKVMLYSNTYHLLHQYHRILAACNTQGERACEFSCDIAQSHYFVVLMQ